MFLNILNIYSCLISNAEVNNAEAQQTYKAVKSCYADNKALQQVICHSQEMAFKEKGKCALLGINIT